MRVAVAACVLMLCVPAPGRAVTLPVAYTAEQSPLKEAIAGTQLTFELHADPACSAAIHTEQVPVEAVALIEKVRTFRVHGAPAPTKVVRLNHVLTGVPAASTYFLSLAGTGVVPVGGACQPQFASQSGAVPCATQVGLDVFFTGCNVHVRDGSGATESTTGLGNLIVGYNENSSGAIRSGSHNLVIGDEHSYSSYAGLLAGFQNYAEGPYVGLVGGIFNRASDRGAVVGGAGNVARNTGFVGGGQENIAGGVFASVTGGRANSATGETSSVTGGSENNAAGKAAAVTGGFSNVAFSENSSVSGGMCNGAGGIGGCFGTEPISPGAAASVSGGLFNMAVSLVSSVSGGTFNAAGVSGAAVSGGSCNVAGFEPAGFICHGLNGPSVSGGKSNRATGPSSWIGGGTSNVASDLYTSVTGGDGNTASGQNASVSGGNGNVASGSYSSVSGGANRTASGDADWAAGSLFEDF